MSILIFVFGFVSGWLCAVIMHWLLLPEPKPEKTTNDTPKKSDSVVEVKHVKTYYGL